MDKKEIKTEFGKRLKNLLSSNKIHQKYLAQALNVEQNTVSSWITGRSEPTLTNIWAIMKYFKTEYKEINALKELFPDFYQHGKTDFSDEDKESLERTINYLTSLKNVY